MDFQTLDQIDVETILDEVSHLLDPTNNILLQKGTSTLHDLPYTNSLFEKYNMTTSRIMKLTPREAYSWHTDVSPRIHFPLITNDSCLFILEDSVYTMPSGNAYYVDTRKKHTALNGNRRDFIRYHIVGLVDELV